jgi:hypothetical protein
MSGAAGYHQHSEFVMPYAGHSRLCILTCGKKDVDGRAQASGSDAVLRTSMPGHDDEYSASALQRGALLSQ